MNTYTITLPADVLTYNMDAIIARTEVDGVFHDLDPVEGELVFVTAESVDEVVEDLENAITAAIGDELGEIELIAEQDEVNRNHFSLSLYVED